MPLANFGSILNFAETLENQGREFYAAVLKEPLLADLHDLAGQFAKDAKKNIQTVQRARRENVTEMILEPIQDFTRAPFQWEPAPASLEAPAKALAAMRGLEETAENYYQTAATKIKAMPEIARALKTIAKKHGVHLKKLAFE